MATIMSSQSTDYDGSGSPSTGSGDVNVSFRQTPENGGNAQLWARPTSTSIAYTKIWDSNFPELFKFGANGLDYYYTWTITTAGAVADLEG